MRMIDKIDKIDRCIAPRLHRSGAIREMWSAAAAAEVAALEARAQVSPSGSFSAEISVSSP